MSKHAVYFVSCKNDSSNKLQFWNPSLCMIYSQCCHCKDMTGYGQSNYMEHYNLYEIVVKKERGMSYHDMWDAAEKIVESDKEKYRVKDFTDALILTKKRIKNKEK